jgi:hypothetical protein
MALSLAATGYFIYLVEPWTPDAVVASVVVFNAAFGYRYDHYRVYLIDRLSHMLQLGSDSLVVPARGELCFW